MADLASSFKSAWVKGMEALGNTASTIANTTKFKVSELNIENEKREILNGLGALAYDLWKKGEKFPEALEAKLKALAALDMQLETMHAERRAAQGEAGQKASEACAAAGESGKAEREAPTLDVSAPAAGAVKPPLSDVPVIDVEEPETLSGAPRQDPIDLLMSRQDRLKTAAEETARAAAALDDIQEAVGGMGQALDDAIEGMSDDLNGKRD